jgi:hypothetical protein
MIVLEGSRFVGPINPDSRQPITCSNATGWLRKLEPVSSKEKEQFAIKALIANFAFSFCAISCLLLLLFCFRER